MKKILGVAAAMIATLLAVALSAPAAQAYPSPVFDISVSQQVVVGGHTFVGHAHASVRCHDWTLTFLEQSAHGPGKTFNHRFDTPVVQTKTTYPMHARCVYSVDAGATGSSPRAADQTWTGTVPITLLPQKSHGQAAPANSAGAGGGLLPNTGGPSFWILIAAIVLIIGGGGAVLRSRRRSAGPPA
ncbi:LPXTG cell wall anchor domain-containing protein [Nocardioides terrisoli]|uniref:LPXTG cell wall anchor domain-containing protein n=1 Tax=Nocardioides terrisoli TaxID=3388267 RepID=UPI00287B908A|nr:LPXTG cell wall anchor domain-containing protein [Nocardioides marmorisolisilvae]